MICKMCLLQPHQVALGDSVHGFHVKSSRPHEEGWQIMPAIAWREPTWNSTRCKKNIWRGFKCCGTQGRRWPPGMRNQLEMPALRGGGGSSRNKYLCFVKYSHTQHKNGDCRTSTWEVETGGSRVPEHSYLHCELKASLGKMRPCLKTTNKLINKSMLTSHTHEGHI